MFFNLSYWRNVGFGRYGGVPTGSAIAIQFLDPSSQMCRLFLIVQKLFDVTVKLIFDILQFPVSHMILMWPLGVSQARGHDWFWKVDPNFI